MRRLSDCHRTSSVVLVGLSMALLLLVTPLVGAQQSSLAGSADTTVDVALTYLDSAAMWMGDGIVGLLNRGLSTPLPITLGRPLGYLIVLSLFFGLAVASRKTRILLLVALLVSWGLLIAQFVTEAIG